MVATTGRDRDCPLLAQPVTNGSCRTTLQVVWDLISPVLTVSLQDDGGEDVVADAAGEEEGPRTSIFFLLPLRHHQRSCARTPKGGNELDCIRGKGAGALIFRSGPVLTRVNGG